MIPTKFNKLQIAQDNGLRKIYVISCLDGPTVSVYNNDKVLFYVNYLGLYNQQFQDIQYCEIQNGISLDMQSGFADKTSIIQIYVNQKLVISDLIFYDAGNTITTINLPKINKNQNYYIKIYDK